MALAISEAVPEVATTSNASTYTTGTFTPEANALLVLFAFVTDTFTDPASASGGGLTWTMRYTSTLASYGGSGQNSCYIATAQVGATPAAMTVTMNVTGDAGSGCVMFVYQVTGHDTSDPIVQAFKQAFGGGANPAMTLPSAMGTDNCYMAAIAEANRNPINCSVTGWTEIGDTGYATPTNGAAAYYRVNGETGSTVTFTTAAAAAGFGAVFIEIRPDTTPPPTPPAPTPPAPPPSGGGGGPWTDRQQDPSDFLREIGEDYPNEELVRLYETAERAVFASFMTTRVVERGNLLIFLARIPGAASEVGFVYIRPGENRPIADPGLGHPASHIRQLGDNLYAVSVDTTGFQEGFLRWHFFSTGLPRSAFDEVPIRIHYRDPRLL